MIQFLNAFVWTTLLVLLTGIFVLGLEWTGLYALHAPKPLIFGVEGLSVIGLLVLFWIVFQHALTNEKEMSQHIESE